MNVFIAITLTVNYAHIYFISCHNDLTMNTQISDSVRACVKIYMYVLFENIFPFRSKLIL